jgi:hypothetical protein
MKYNTIIYRDKNKTHLPDLFTDAQNVPITRARWQAKYRPSVITESM